MYSCNPALTTCQRIFDEMQHGAGVWARVSVWFSAGDWFQRNCNARGKGRIRVVVFLFLCCYDFVPTFTRFACVRGGPRHSCLVLPGFLDSGAPEESRVAADWVAELLVRRFADRKRAMLDTNAGWVNDGNVSFVKRLRWVGLGCAVLYR